MAELRGVNEVFMLVCLIFIMTPLKPPPLRELLAKIALMFVITLLVRFTS